MKYIPLKLNSEKRKKLLAKRKELQSKIVAKEQRLLIQGLLLQFDLDGIEYDIIFPDYKTLEAPELKWMQSHFPMTSWGRIDWREIACSMAKKCESGLSCEKLLGKIIEEQQLGNPVVTLMWTNAHRPNIQLKLYDVVQNTQIIFEQDWDTWIVCSKNKWCIEYHHDGEISYGSNTC